MLQEELQSIKVSQPLFKGLSKDRRRTPGRYDRTGKWRTLVSIYSRRHLTFPGDKLPALAGLATEVSNRINGDYIQSLWSRDICATLI
jgi:hypothetical protein